MADEILDPKIGYVIEIPNNKTIIINIGSDDGYFIGDKFKIYEEGPKIIDTQTNEVLGRKDYTKVTVEVVESYPNFSECQRIVTKERSTFATVATMVQGSSYKEAVDLPVSDEQNKQWAIKNPEIKINDPVKIA